MTRIEYAAATSTGNVHRKYASREQAQAFIDEAPVPMHLLMRETGGERAGRWVYL